MVQDRAMADQSKVIYVLSNGTIFNDLEQPLTQISRSRHYLILNTSEAVNLSNNRYSYNEILIGT